MRVESARKLVEVAPVVHAMFMASEIAPQIPARRPTPFSWDVAARLDGPCTSRVGCGDRSAHRKELHANSGEMTDVEEDRLAGRWSDACGVLGRGFVRAGRCGFGPGRRGLLQDSGVPKGCVVRPTGVAVVATPVVGVGAVGVGAPGVGVRPGTPMNRGGPVNRVGRR